MVTEAEARRARSAAARGERVCPLARVGERRAGVCLASAVGGGQRAGVAQAAAGPSARRAPGASRLSQAEWHWGSERCSDLYLAVLLT